MKRSQLPSQNSNIQKLIPRQNSFKSPIRLANENSQIPPAKKHKGQEKDSLIRVESPNDKSDKLNLIQEVWSCMYRKPSSKKHKSWEGDGFIIIQGKVYYIER